MQLQKDTAPDAPTPLSAPAIANDAPPPEAPSRFKQALAEVESHRQRVTAAVGVALLARLLFEFQFVDLLRNASSLVVQLPYLGLAMLSYLLVLMWLTGRTRDRFGFGMALGIGVMESVYLLVVAAMHRPFNFGEVWAPIVVALAHVPMAVFAFRASTAYPPLDSKKPWLVGFVTAVVFLAIPWIAPSLLDALTP
jgi:hypothetical protein